MAQACGGISSEGQASMLQLKSCEGEALQVERGAALLSSFLKDVLNFTFCGSDSADADEALIPIKYCTDGGAFGPDTHTLSKVIEYCSLHRSSNPKMETGEYGRASWTAEETTYMDGFRWSGADPTLFKVMMAADYMDVEGLIDLTCEAVADMIRNKSAQEIRELFNIQNDFDPEEEEAHLQSSAWALESEDH